MSSNLWLAYGPSGGGKSHFAAVCDEQPYPTLFVDTESRIGAFNVPKANLLSLDVQSKVDLRKLMPEILKRLEANKALKRVAIDSLSNLQVLRQFSMTGDGGRLSGYDAWGQLKADFLWFILQLGMLRDRGYEVLCTAHEGEMPDPLYIPPLKEELDPLKYKAPLGTAPTIKVPEFDGAFQKKVSYYFDWVIFVTEVPSVEKVTHRYFFERRGMFYAKKPPTKQVFKDGYVDNTTWDGVLKLVGKE